MATKSLPAKKPVTRKVTPKQPVTRTRPAAKRVVPAKVSLKARTDAAYSANVQALTLLFTIFALAYLLWAILSRN